MGQMGTLMKLVEVSVFNCSRLTAFYPRITWLQEPLSAASYCALGLQQQLCPTVSLGASAHD